MSTANLQTFFVNAPYVTDSGMIERRSKVRESHLVRVRELIASGTIRIGGALLKPDNALGATPTAFASAMIVQAGSLDDVKAILEHDVYWKENVWDKERLQICPMMLA